jgi:Big-like domain-containing protein
MITFALALLLDASLPPPRDWMAVRNGAVELALVHRETDRLDGGILTVDPRRRLVVWEGIAGELGCRAKVEASFDDVRSVAVGEPGFALEFRKGKNPRMLFIPRPHAQWLMQERKIRTGVMSQLVMEGRVDMGGPDGDALPLTGSAATTAPRIEHLNLPSTVSADTRAAVEAIRDALGRTPAPGTLVREALYGSTWEVSPTDIAESPAEFEGQAVRVRGRFEAATTSAPARLVDESGAGAFVTADTEIARLVAVEDKRWPGQTIELTGVVRRDTTAPAQGPRYVVSFWDFDASALPAPPVIAADAATLKLPDLIADPEAVKGRLVRVVGQFRGHNLYGDLPAASFRHRLDWVLKDERAAVWVTGRPPRGRDFKLDPNVPDDVRTWLEVVGRAVVRDGQVVVRADKIALVPAPAAARVKAVRIAAGSNVPPVVVFSLPIDGDRIRSDARLVIQFNKYMDDDSFAGHVELRYADSPASRGFPDIKLAYDEGKRALIIDPGAALDPGRPIECRLLAGIVDADGLPLVPRQGAAAPEVVDVLRFEVER